MNKQIEIIVYAVSMILKAALSAAAWAGRIRKHELESIAKIPAGEKGKEILFLSDRIYQLVTRIDFYLGFLSDRISP